MDARIDWIWLQQALGPGNAKAGRLLSHFCSASAVWEAEPRQWLEAGFPFRNRNGWPKETGTAPAACWTRCCPPGTGF